MWRNQIQKLSGPVIGLIAGLSYALLEWWFDKHGKKDASKILWKIHESFDFILPITLGILVGAGIVFLQRINLLNKALSTQNNHLRSRLTANTLLAHVLHEIRNPVHNLTAIMDHSLLSIPNNDREIIERNLQRLNEATEHFKRISGPWDEISTREPTFFLDWIHNFISQSVSSSLREKNIRYSEQLQPFKVFMHPLLLEQCFSVLFENAIHACEQTVGTKEIVLSSCPDTAAQNLIYIEISNSGSPFPPEVLAAEGKKTVRSSKGMGLGLVLLRDTAELVGGSIKIFNAGQHAHVRLYLPAEFKL